MFITRRLQRFAVASCVALAATPMMAAQPLAVAQETNSLESLQTQADDLVGRIEETTEAYRQATTELEDLEARIADNEARSAQIEQELPEQRARTAASIKSLYILQQSTNGLLDLLLSSESFEEFISTINYIESVQQHSTSEIASLTALEDELIQTQALLVAQRDAAAKKQDETLAALEEARSARVDLQEHAIAIALTETDAREEAIAIAVAALESADAAAASLPEGAEAPLATFTTSSGNTAVVEVPASPSVSTEPLLTNTTSEETGDWAARINAYLAGSPLEGYGQVFADAAAQYGVDPRLSPAIATIESGKGEVCFKDYNAWGWGSSSWDSWESAIYEQVEGLAIGYDGTLTLEGAERYCPPNYQEWYSSVASEMDDI